MTFKDIINDEEILNALEAINISEPSEIQSAAIPLMLTGVDLIGQAQTGTGKTFAYGIPTLINTTNKPFETLILCPTRELSIQVSKELKKLLTFTLLERETDGYKRIYGYYQGSDKNI